MEKGLLDVVGHLKKLLITYREMGLEPPSLSPLSLDYLRGGGFHQDTLEGLRATIGDCKRCKLWQGRTNLVFGEGTPQARLVFVGEGPGKEEDLEGRPFVGEAGRLLTRIIHAMGLTREEVYICNVVKCRPPNNRDPEEDEIKACTPFLRKQLEFIRPAVICTLGRIAARGLLGKEIRITKERGTWQSYDGIPVMLTYHPAYLIRNPSAKRPVWEDVQKIMTLLGLEVKKND